MHASKAGRTGTPRWVRGALAGVIVAALAAGCGGTEPERLLAVTIMGGDQGFAYGDTVHLYANAIHSDGRYESITGAADWVSSSTSVATVELSPGGYTAVVTRVAPGEVVITATYEGLTATKALTGPPP
jgi:hypothetical protein